MSGISRSLSPTDSAPSEIHEPEAEWRVDDILAERVMKRDGLGHPPGTRCWLVKWTGFGLAEATWEPQENLSDDLLNMWKVSQDEYTAGTKTPFKVREWKKACQKYWKEKVQRQERRNSKRAKRGLSPQALEDLECIRETLKSVDSEDDSEEDVDWTMLDRNGAEMNRDSESLSTTSAESTRSSHGSLMEDGRYKDINEPSKEPRAGRHVAEPNDDGPVKVRSTSGKSDGETRQSRSRSNDQQDHAEQPRASSSTKATRPLDARSQDSSAQSQSSSRSKQPVDVGVHVPPHRPALPSSSRTSKRPQVLLRATRTPKPIVPEAVGNVFAGGKQPRKRKSIETAAARPDGAQKQLKPRLQNILK
jgi:chromo domain-containing protein 1